jgi:hypothetical protein
VRAARHRPDQEALHTRSDHEHRGEDQNESERVRHSGEDHGDVEAESREHKQIALPKVHDRGRAEDHSQRQRDEGVDRALRHAADQ